MEIFRYPSLESLESDMTELQESGIDDFFSDAFSFLNQSLLEVADRSLEAHLLQSQIEELSHLNSLYKDEFQQSFTRETNAAVSERFRAILGLLQSGDSLSTIREEIESLIDSELDRLADTINPLSDRTARDIIERNINVTGRIWESVSESPEVEEFYNLFTIEYINHVGRETSVIDGILQCDRLALTQILERVKSRLSRSSLSLLDMDFIFSTLDGDIQMSFQNIFTPQDAYEDGEIEEYLRGGVDVTRFIGHIDFYQLVEFFRQELISSQEVLIFLREAEIGVDRENLMVLYNEGIITGEQAWDFFEGDAGFQEERNGGFSLSDALENFGFSQGLQRDINTIFGRELSQEETTHLINMICYFLYVESSMGYNVSNYEGASTARGYFQYLTGDGGYLREILVGDEWTRGGRWLADHEESNTVRRVWGNNSYETALFRVPEEVVDFRPIFGDEREKRGNPSLQNPMDLSAEEQIILFVSDLQERRGVTREMIESMLDGDVDAVDQLYRAHHTNTDSATEIRMLLAKRQVYGIEIEVFRHNNNTVEGIILPGTGMTEFFMQLIRELNPSTRLTESDVMGQLNTLGNVRFPAGGVISISRSSQDGVAYILRHNGRDYMRVSNSGTFTYVF